jgi:hypothetical protein
MTEIIAGLDKIIPAVLYLFLCLGPIIGFFLIAFGRFWSGGIILAAWLLLVISLL